MRLHDVRIFAEKPGAETLSNKNDVKCEETVGFTGSTKSSVREHELRHPCQVSCAKGHLVKRSLGRGRKPGFREAALH